MREGGGGGGGGADRKIQYYCKCKAMCQMKKAKRPSHRFRQMLQQVVFRHPQSAIPMIVTEFDFPYVLFISDLSPGCLLLLSFNDVL